MAVGAVLIAAALSSVARTAVVTTITIDGDMSDWTAVLADPYQRSDDGPAGGLADLDARCLRQFERVFVEGSGSQRLALLRALDAELTVLRDADAAAPSGNAAEHERHFFHRMKMLTLYGYYTSEIGQTEELQAVIIPGRYDPCGPLGRDSSGVW